MYEKQDDERVCCVLHVCNKNKNSFLLHISNCCDSVITLSCYRIRLLPYQFAITQGHVDYWVSVH